MAGAKLLGVLTVVASLICGIHALPHNEVNPLKEADAIAELEVLRAQRHAREAQESAALARYAYEKLAQSQKAAAETAGDAALEDVILDARRDASEAVKITSGRHNGVQAERAGGSFLQELKTSDAHHAFEKAQARLAKLQSVSREQLRQTSQELLEVQKQIQSLQRHQAPVKQEASSKEKLLETHKIRAEPLVAQDTTGIPAGVFTQLSSKEMARNGVKVEQKLATAEKALAQQKATLEQKRVELSRVQSEIEEVQEAAARLQGRDAKAKKQNLALLETLRSMSRADKAQRQQAEAESQRLNSEAASQQQELLRQQQELASQQAQVAALQEELRRKRGQRQHQETEVHGRTVLLQKAQEHLHSTEEAVSDLKRQEAASSFDLRIIKEEQLGTATQSLSLKDLEAARSRREQRAEALEKVVDAESKNISDLSFALEQEKSHPLVQELRKKSTEVARVFKEKAGTARKTMGLIQEQATQQSGQLRATFRAKSLAAQAKRQEALISLEAKFESETRQELAELEAKNRSLSHQLVLLQQQDETQVEVRHRATARALQQELDQVKSKTAQLLDKAARAASQTEARLEDNQKKLDLDLQQKEQSILNLQQQRLEDGEKIQSMQQEMAEASSQEKKLTQELREEKEQRVRVVSNEEVQLTQAAQKVQKAEQEEEKRKEEEIRGLKREVEAEEDKNHFQKSRKVAQLEREIQRLPRVEETEISQLAAALEEKETKLQEVRKLLVSEQQLGSAAKVELKNLRERLR